MTEQIDLDETHELVLAWRKHRRQLHALAVRIGWENVGHYLNAFLTFDDLIEDVNALGLSLDERRRFLAELTVELEASLGERESAHPSEPLPPTQH